MARLSDWSQGSLSRRRFLAAGVAAASGSAISAGSTKTRGGAGSASPEPSAHTSGTGQHSRHGATMTVGDVDEIRNGFDTAKLLTDWDTGTVTDEPDGRRLRTFVIEAIDKEIEIAPGIMFPAWTYNGRVPGPSLRATEGEKLRIVFRNYGSHPHSLHFHGIHSARMDGIPGAGVISPGEEFVYEFDAKPFGCHFYHCHALPLKRHIHKGLYGLFVVDPDPAQHPEHADITRSRPLHRG